MNLKYLKYAIALGYRNLGITKDNPSVGAVIVKNNKIIGKGSTQPPPGKHAEIMAIEDAIKNGYSLENSSMYVTLEPCSFYGRTPACAIEISKTKIKEVIIGITDPNPKVNGNGIKILETNKKVVKYNFLKDEIKYLHRFFIKHLNSNLPYITLKIATSLDGYIGKKDSQIWLTNEASKRFSHRLRHFYDAILVGFDTLIVDNPLLNIRYKFKNYGEKSNINKIILWSSRRHLSPEQLENLNIFKQKDTNIFIIGDNFSKEEKSFFNKKENIKVFNKNSKDTKEILEIFAILKKNYEIYSILIEGGAKIFNFFLQEDIYDELNLFYSNKILKNGIKLFNEYLDFSEINLNLFKQKKLGKNNFVIIYVKDYILK